MRLDNWLSQRATTSPGRFAVGDAAESLNFAEYEARATRLARMLGSRGVRRGSVVAIGLAPGVEYACLVQALMKLGAIAQPLNPRLTDVERDALLAASRPALIVEEAIGNGAPEADLPLLGEHDLDDTLCLIQTSGTSGVPRPIGLTYGNHLFSAVGSAFNLGIDPTDRWLCCLPLHHIGGFAILTRSVIYGTGVVLHDGFDVERVGAELDSGDVTLMSLVSTQLRRLMDADVDLTGPRAILLGGGPVDSEVVAEAAARGIRVAPSYGLTESTSQVTTLAPGDAADHPGSSGRPLLTTHIRIESGEILVQGPTVAPGCADDDGWLHTGDLGHIDDNGFLYVTGRVGDVIVSGGENIVPDEIEAALASHPDVVEAAVVGRPDPDWQEAVTAVVVARPGTDPGADDLRAHCARVLSPHKIPKRFEFVAELPRTASGKLLRRSLR